MAHGRVFLAGPEDDPLIAWLRERLQSVGYWPQTPALGREAIYSSTASALPLVAGVEVWQGGQEERVQALAAMDAQMPLGSPLLALCTATPVDALAGQVKRPARLVGYSLFGPPAEGTLVEVLPGTATNQEAPRRAAMFLGSLGFNTEILPHGAWAVFPRVVAATVNEAAYALQDGSASAADIDLAMRVGAGFALGPLALADAIGIDRIVGVLEALQHEYGETYRPAPVLRQLLRAGRTGRAAGRGFHSYGAGASQDP